MPFSLEEVASRPSDACRALLGNSQERNGHRSTACSTDARHGVYKKVLLCEPDPGRARNIVFTSRRRRKSVYTLA